MLRVCWSWRLYEILLYIWDWDAIQPGGLLMPDDALKAARETWDAAKSKHFAKVLKGEAESGKDDWIVVLLTHERQEAEDVAVRKCEQLGQFQNTSRGLQLSIRRAFPRAFAKEEEQCQ
jgi:hypothetical protein